MGSRQIVLASTAGISILNAGIFWREAKTKRLFSQCMFDIFSMYFYSGEKSPAGIGGISKGAKRTFLEKIRIKRN